jgi:hypothetical protein
MIADPNAGHSYTTKWPALTSALKELKPTLNPDKQATSLSTSNFIFAGPTYTTSSKMLKGGGMLCYKKGNLWANYEGAWSEESVTVNYVHFGSYFYHFKFDGLVAFGSKIKAKVENNRILFHTSALSDEYHKREKRPLQVLVSFPFFLDEDPLAYIAIPELKITIKWNPFTPLPEDVDKRTFLYKIGPFRCNMILDGETWLLTGSSEGVHFYCPSLGKEKVESLETFWENVSHGADGMRKFVNTIPSLSEAEWVARVKERKEIEAELARKNQFIVALKEELENTRKESERRRRIIESYQTTNPAPKSPPMEATPKQLKEK